MPPPRRPASSTLPLSKAPTFRLLNLVYPSDILSFASRHMQLCFLCRRGDCCICQGSGYHFSSGFPHTKAEAPHFPCLLHHIRREHWPNSKMNSFLICFWFYGSWKTLQSSIYYQPVRYFSRLLRFSYLYPVRPNISHQQAFVYWQQGALFSQLIALLCSSWESRILLLKYLDISDTNCREYFCCLCHHQSWHDLHFPPAFLIKNGLPCLLKHFICPVLGPIEMGLSRSGFCIDSDNLLDWITFFKHLYHRLIIRQNKVLTLQDLAGLQLLRTLSNFPDDELRVWKSDRQHHLHTTGLTTGMNYQQLG
ncbi:PREDICTED: uncharacterized protein LOC107541405 [Miniopterus natalensis]|uniref:uncharacterized protein LOC107541405 n=1 Tax=Miniopterus natalensis TaxID=291302 RepID=UPI0007A70F5F|nr:PREDICTED: uncharacterized protein LOC107541405 [Miniopterus natalensis]